MTNNSQWNVILINDSNQFSNATCTQVSVVYSF